MEVETFRDILCRQTDTLQGYFDSCAENDTGRSTNQKLDLEDNLEDDAGIKIFPVITIFIFKRAIFREARI